MGPCEFKRFNDYIICQRKPVNAAKREMNFTTQTIPTLIYQIHPGVRILGQVNHCSIGSNCYNARVLSKSAKFTPVPFGDLLGGFSMMRTLRDKRTMHVVLWTLLVVFIVGGVFFGFGMRYSSMNGKYDTSVYAAKVGDSGVTRADFNKAYQPVLDKIYAAEPEGPTSEETQQLQQQVLNSLIDDLILEDTAKKLNISVSDEELAATIRRQPYFADQNGNFDKEKYAQILQANQLTVEQYESSQRQEILLQKIRSVLLDGVLFTRNEAEDYFSLLNRDLKAVYVVLDEAIYEKNIKFSEDDLKEFYENTRSQYDHPERVKIRHIFITPTQSEGFQDADKAQKMLEDYRQQVLSGKAKFQDLAQKYSQDDRTKNRGGEIGWIERGTLPKEAQTLEDNIFGLKKGEITKPFKLQNGYDIAQIEDYEPAYKSTFDLVHSKVLDQYRKEKAAQKIEAISEQLIQKLKNKLSLVNSAKELGLSTTITDWFNRQAGVPNISGSKDAAGELASLYPQQWKGPLAIQQKEYFFQIIDARDEKNPKPMSDQDQVQLTQRMNYERQQSWLQDFLTFERKKLGVKNFLDG
jgi:parvulin-like peptidyl-prolyl isomerase